MLYIDKGLIHQEDKMIMSTQAPNIRAHKYIKQILTELKGGFHRNIARVEAFNKPQSIKNKIQEIINKKNLGSSCCGLVVINPTSIHDDVGLIPGLVQWVEDPELP